MTRHDPPQLPTTAELDTFAERWRQTQAAHNRERRRRKPRPKPGAGYRLPPWPNKNDSGPAQGPGPSLNKKEATG